MLCTGVAVTNMLKIKICFGDFHGWQYPFTRLHAKNFKERCKRFCLENSKKKLSLKKNKYFLFVLKCK